MRDGVSISSEDKFNMLFGAIFKELKNQIPDDLKEIVKIANLDKNEHIFKNFMNWSYGLRDQGLVGDSDKAFESKTFENKQEYNKVIGNILKLYINQGKYMLC
jgi:hypothetical protein